VSSLHQRSSMKMARTCFLSCFALAFAAAAEAKAVTDVSQQEGEATILKAMQLKQPGGDSAGATTPLQPALEPESSKKFFSQDYPHDQNPGSNGLHFKHPYPAVQDSGDFDSDFVKDQNTDNGEFKAQQNYDRIRKQLQGQYVKAEKALKKKKVAEKKYETTLEDYGEDIEEAKIKRKEYVEDLEEIAEEKKKEEERLANKYSTTPKPKEKEGCWWPWSMWCCGWWPWSCPAEPKKPNLDKYRDAHEVLATDLEGATRQVEQAVRDLKECEKELAKDQQDLKRQLDELQEDKVKKVESDEKEQQAGQIEDKEETQLAVAKEKLAEEVSEHAKAEAAYLKQKEIVEKMLPALNAAAKKVEALRDSEDKNGGVFPVERDHDDVARRGQSSAKGAGVSVSIAMMLAMVMN